MKSIYVSIWTRSYNRLAYIPKISLTDTTTEEAEHKGDMVSSRWRQSELEYKDHQSKKYTEDSLNKVWKA
jgi:hypothetical protein